MASSMGKPAYVVFGDKTLHAIVREIPDSLDALMQIEGIGPAKAERFGDSVIKLCRARSS
jgi:ATP-dependent DNA helicase RecQ